MLERVRGDTDDKEFIPLPAYKNQFTGEGRKPEPLS